MQKKEKLIENLDKRYFWDVDISRLDPERNRRLIIERVFEFGEVAEMKLIIKYYGASKVIEVLKGLNYLHPKTLNLVSKYFNIPKESFKCYQKRLSNPKLWS